MAFLINWILVISNAAAVAAVALIGADYIKPFLLPVSLQKDMGTKLITITAVAILYLINLGGVKMSVLAQNALTLFKIAMIYFRDNSIKNTKSAFVS